MSREVRAVAPPGERPFDVVGLGANAADHLVTIPRFPRPGEKVRFRRYLFQGGGQTATALVTAARLGLRARYIGGVGDDAEGQALKTELAAERIDVTAVRVRPGGLTQRALILVDETNGERTIIWGRSAGMVIGPQEVEPEEVACGRVLLTDAQDPRSAAVAARAAHAAGMPVIADLEVVRPGVEEFLPLIDYLITDQTFPYELTAAGDLGAALRAVAVRAPAAQIIATCGSQGAVALIAGELELLPAYAISAVDTTGAGDVFHGAFAVALLSDYTLREGIDFGNAVAAMKCLAPGGRTGIPRSLASVERFRRETPHCEGPPHSPLP